MNLHRFETKGLVFLYIVVLVLIDVAGRKLAATSVAGWILLNSLFTRYIIDFLHQRMLHLGSLVNDVNPPQIIKDSLRPESRDVTSSFMKWNWNSWELFFALKTCWLLRPYFPEDLAGTGMALTTGLGVWIASRSTSTFLYKSLLEATSSSKVAHFVVTKIFFLKVGPNYINGANTN